MNEMFGFGVEWWALAASFLAGGAARNLLGYVSASFQQVRQALKGWQRRRSRKEVERIKASRRLELIAVHLDPFLDEGTAVVWGVRGRRDEFRVFAEFGYRGYSLALGADVTYRQIRAGDVLTWAYHSPFRREKSDGPTATHCVTIDQVMACVDLELDGTTE